MYDPKTNIFASFNKDGTAKTFHKPDPRTYRRPTNLDYWNETAGSCSMGTVGQRHPCPVCGYLLECAPWRGDSAADEMCPSCGIQFGYDDHAGADPNRRAAIYAHWRNQWIGSGMPWSSRGIPPPNDWDPAEQLRRAERSY